MIVMMNKTEEFMSCKNYITALIAEEVKALKRGEIAYCFNSQQFQHIQNICNKKGIAFTYEKDEDNYYTLTPCNILIDNERKI